jgi:undecaprenyl-diphosphatase
VMTLLMRIGEFDRVALNAPVARRSSAFYRLMQSLTHLGDDVIMIGVATGLVFLSGPDFRPAGLQAVFALATSQIAVQLLRRAIARPRPQLPAGVGSLIAAPDRFSFPSGHAAATLAVALPLATALPTPARARRPSARDDSGALAGLPGRALPRGCTDWLGAGSSSALRLGPVVIHLL